MKVATNTRRKTLVTRSLLALLVAGWTVLAQQDATHAATVASQTRASALPSDSPPARNTPVGTPAPQVAVRVRTTTASATATPAQATPMQTSVAGAGLGTQTAGSAGAASTPSLSGAAASLPTARPTTPPTRSLVPAAPAQAIIAGFPSVTQWYNLDCEYAAAAAVTLYWGRLVSQDTFVSSVPSNPNPHLGFRGAINAPFGGITNYGVYAEALVPVLTQRGYNAVTFYGGVTRLKAEVAAGHPVVVWFTAGKYVARTPVIASGNGATFTLVRGKHAVVIYGYDSGGVYIMDVSHGLFDYATWGSFETRWSYFDQMALVITPKLG